MYREFTITCAATSKDLYTLMLAITGAVPSNSILPDRCKWLKFFPSGGNAGTVTLQDSQDAANNIGHQLGVPEIVGPFNVASICLRDYMFIGSDASQVIGVQIEY